MSIQKRGKRGIYSGVFYVKKKQVWRSLHTTDKKEAQIRYAELLKKVPTANRLPWDYFKDRYLQYSKANHRKSTYARDITTLRIFEVIAQAKDVRDLTIHTLEHFKETRINDGKNASTINRELGTLKAMYRRAMEWEYLPRFDLSGARKLKEERKLRPYFEPKQIQLIRRAGKDIGAQVRIDLALYTGFRRSEQLMLRWQDVDFKQDLIYLRSYEGRSLKNYQERKIRLHPVLKQTLIKWKAVSNHTHILENITPRVLTRWWFRLFKRLQIKATLHATRHTVGTHMARKLGIDQAKEFLGHSSVKTTERYSHQKSEMVPVDVLDY